MKIGVIGLGKMGSAIAYRFIKFNFEVIGYDIDKIAIKQVEKFGVLISKNIEDISKQCDVIWLMLPAGKIIDNVINKLLPNLKKNSVIIDGGNSHFQDSILRAKKLKKQGMDFLDCGTSGGLEGKKNGFCLMIGGNKLVFNKIKKVFKAIAAPKGYAYIGASGSGHYVKMVHNGIEYALLQAYSEGLNVLKNGEYKNLNLEKISEIWMHGSIIRSYILELISEILIKDQNFASISGVIGGGETGTWAYEEAKKQNISVPLLEKSLEIRKNSKNKKNYATKLVALLRNKFGGHTIL